MFYDGYLPTWLVLTLGAVAFITLVIGVLDYRSARVDRIPSPDRAGPRRAAGESDWNSQAQLEDARVAALASVLRAWRNESDLLPPLVGRRDELRARTRLYAERSEKVFWLPSRNDTRPVA